MLSIWFLVYPAFLSFSISSILPRSMVRKEVSYTFCPAARLSYGAGWNLKVIVVIIQ